MTYRFYSVTGNNKFGYDAFCIAKNIQEIEIQNYKDRISTWNTRKHSCNTKPYLIKETQVDAFLAKIKEVNERIFAEIKRSNKSKTDITAYKEIMEDRK